MDKPDLRTHPIPSLKSALGALDYHHIPFDLESDKNKESLVNVEDYGICARSAYARAYGPYKKAFANALPQVYVRESVAKLLADCNRLLRAYGVELLALDGYRPIALIKELWQYFLERGRELIKNPSEQDLIKFAGTYASNPESFNAQDPSTWPVHNSGGAIDVTLINIEDKKELFFCSYFDQADPISATRYFEREDLNSAKEKEARENRRLLYHAMTAVGFVNYPHEWWHYDFGTQMWVMNGSEKEKAFYGCTELR